MPTLPALPISLYVSGRRVVLVGDGRGASERLERLRAANADVAHLAADEYSAEAVRSAFAVIANDDDDDLNRRVAADAKAAGALAYAHDQPDISDFAMPALVRRGPLQIAISTNAVAPALSRRLREELERVVSAAGAQLDQLLGELAEMRRKLPRGQRGQLYQRLARRLRIDGKLIVDDSAD